MFIAASNKNVVVSQGFYLDCYDYSTHNILQMSNIPGEDTEITDVIISHDGNLLAVLISKKIIIYDLPQLKIVQNFVLPRSASKIRFGVENTQIFVADKTGDVLQFDINKSSATKLLGHLSLLLNVLQTNDGKYIISSDRDEKIRVSCYPNTYNIQTYCLGHKEFVNHIELIPHMNGYLTSASGDGTIKLWNYIDGALLYNIDTYIGLKNNKELKEQFTKVMDEEGIEINSLPIVGYTITKLNDSSYIMAVTVHSYMKILVYRLNFINAEFSHNIVQEIPVNNLPAVIKFHNLSLFVFDNIVSELYEYKVFMNNDNTIINLCNTIKVFENMQIKLSTCDHNSIKLLFKRKFNNVQEYQERKKQRLEKPLS